MYKVNNLIISENSNPFNEIRNLFLSAKHSIVIFSPYIKSSALEKLLKDIEVPITIITTWKIKDLLLGYSELELYNLSCKPGLKVQVFISNSIHLKIYIKDWNSCIFGSANATASGLGIAKNSNYEICGSVSEIDPGSLLYLRGILNESDLLDSELYDEFVSELGKLEKIELPKEVELTSLKRSEFLISKLPMSRSVSILFDIYVNIEFASNKEDKDCALHDIALYKIPSGLTPKDFDAYLQEAFFSSVFTGAFISYICDSGKYFGEVKAWIQKNCQDVPVPSRRDLTGNIQVLYRWVEYLGNGAYRVDRPNYSEKILKITTDHIYIPF